MIGRGFTDEVTFPVPKWIVYNPVTNASNSGSTRVAGRSRKGRTQRRCRTKPGNDQSWLILA